MASTRDFSIMQTASRMPNFESVSKPPNIHESYGSTPTAMHTKKTSMRASASLSMQNSGTQSKTTKKRIEFDKL